MICYSQSLGQFEDDDGDVIVSGAYSGGDHGLQPGAVNNPALQSIKDVGPIPVGVYAIGPAEIYPHLGPLCMSLTPYPATAMFGRSGFMIHGDNDMMNRSASDGCIVVCHEGRAKISAMVASGKNTLTVTT